MQRRKYLTTISATMSGLALAGCSSEGDDGDGGDEATPTDDDDGDGGDEATPTDDDNGDGGSEDRPTSMDGVTITEPVFELAPLVADGGEDGLIVGAVVNNENSQEVIIQSAFEIQFPDGDPFSDRGRFSIPTGEKRTVGGFSLTSDGPFTESQIEHIKNGDAKYQTWIEDVEGASSGGSGNGDDSSSNQCDESVLNDNDSNSVRWEGFANGTTEIESIDLTLESYVDFPVSATITVFFYRESGDIAPMHQVSRTVEIEGRGFRQIQITDTRGAGDWDADLTELSCP